MDTNFTIKTKRLELEPLGMRHFDGVCSYSMSLENAKMMVYLPRQSVSEVADFIQRAEVEWAKTQPDVCEFAVMLDGKQIGGVTMYFEGDYTRGELGWIIHKSYWGKGYAVEAARGLIQYFADKMKLRRFIAHCDSENNASKRVMEKLEMSHVKTYGGRKNRSSPEERLEDLYEIIL